MVLPHFWHQGVTNIARVHGNTTLPAGWSAHHQRGTGRHTTYRSCKFAKRCSFVANSQEQHVEPGRREIRGSLCSPHSPCGCARLCICESLFSCSKRFDGVKWPSPLSQRFVVIILHTIRLRPSPKQHAPDTPVWFLKSRDLAEPHCRFDEIVHSTPNHDLRKSTHRRNVIIILQKRTKVFSCYAPVLTLLKTCSNQARTTMLERLSNQCGEPAETTLSRTNLADCPVASAATT